MPRTTEADKLSTLMLIVAVGAALMLTAVARADDRTSPASTSSHTTETPATQEQAWVKRVGGDTEARAERRDGVWRAGPSFINESLADGYPDPTPPGAIDLKFYPPVRRAQVTRSFESDPQDSDMFFPLFRHIVSRDIAMTAPVENEYDGLTVLDTAERLRPENEDASASMTFVYRSPDLGPTGQAEDDQRVTVTDSPPVTVISMGVQGPYELMAYEDARRTLLAWIETSEDWAFDDDAPFDIRSLSYNGPSVPTALRWGELQIPVRKVVRDDGDPSQTSSENAADQSSGISNTHR